MSPGTIEVTKLDVDLDLPVPCTVFIQFSGDLCGRPSVVRLRTSCNCGRSNQGFLCQVCFNDLRGIGSTTIACSGCLTSDFNWKEI